MTNVSNNPSPWDLSSSAGQDIGACANHVLSPSELLAVEDESISVFPETSIADSALFLQSLESVVLIIDLSIVVVDTFIVFIDSIVVSVNIMVIVINAIFKVVDLVIQLNERFSDGLEGDHQFCLSLDSLFILMLVPDDIPFVEVID